MDNNTTKKPSESSNVESWGWVTGAEEDASSNRSN